MLVLMNSTKTMDLQGKAPGRLQGTEPPFMAQAAELIIPLRRLTLARLAETMALNTDLAKATWGTL